MPVILPLVSATDMSGLEIRRFLGRNYHVEYIVSSHDPERIYFSENTDIGEILLVCRRWNTGEGPKPPTRVVNLVRNPSTPTDAIATAWAIHDGSVLSQGLGTVQEVQSSSIEAGDWGAVQFLSPYLRASFTDLVDGALFDTVHIGEIARIGPEGRRIRDAFRRSTLPGADGMSALWLHDTAVTQSLASEPDTQLEVKSEKAHLAQKYWQQRSRLLLTHRLRLNTGRVNCVRLDVPVVGSSWTTCNLDVQEHDQRIP